MKKLFVSVVLLCFFVNFTSCKKIDETETETKKSEKVEKKVEKEKKSPIELNKSKNQDKTYTDRVQFPSFADLVESQKPSVVNISTTSVVKQRGLFPGIPNNSPNSPFGGNDPFEDFFKRFFGDTPQKNLKGRDLALDLLLAKTGM